MFSDDAQLNLGGNVNKQNCRILVFEKVTKSRLLPPIASATVPCSAMAWTSYSFIRAAKCAKFYVVIIIYQFKNTIKSEIKPRNRVFNEVDTSTIHIHNMKVLSLQTI